MTRYQRTQVEHFPAWMIAALRAETDRRITEAAHLETAHAMTEPECFEHDALYVVEA